MTLRKFLSYIDFDYDVIEEDGEELIHLINNRKNAPTLLKDGWPYNKESIPEIIEITKPYWENISEQESLYVFMHPEEVSL